MKHQTYYNTKYEYEANICNMTDALCVNCAGSVNIDVGVSNHSKRRDYYIIYMLEGSMEISLEGNGMKISKRQLIIIKPDTENQYPSEKNQPLNYLWIHFSGKMAKSIIQQYGLDVNVIYNVGVHSRLSDSWKRMFYEFVINDLYFVDVSACILKEIFVAFSRYISNDGKNQRLVKSIIYIHEHFSEELYVEELAEIEGLSKSHYRVCFKKSVGISPKEYIIDRRIEAACAILEESGKSIEEAAQLVGYSDVYYFGRIFKKKMGISPGKYRGK